MSLSGRLKEYQESEYKDFSQGYLTVLIYSLILKLANFLFYIPHIISVIKIHTFAWKRYTVEY